MASLNGNLLALNLPCRYGRAAMSTLWEIPNPNRNQNDTSPLFETWTVLEPCPEFFFSLVEAPCPERKETAPRVVMADHNVGNSIMSSMRKILSLTFVASCNT